MTAEQIARLGATDTWGVLRQLNGSFRFADTPGGRPIGATTRRGRSSLVITDADMTLVMLDGARVYDIQALRNVPAQTVVAIEFLSGIEATTRFGTNSGAGAVLITTVADSLDAAR